MGKTRQVLNTGTYSQTTYRSGYSLRKCPANIDEILGAEFCDAVITGDAASNQYWQAVDAAGTYQDWTGTGASVQAYQISTSAGLLVTPITGTGASVQAYQTSQGGQATAAKAKLGTRKLKFKVVKKQPAEQPLELTLTDEQIIAPTGPREIIGMAVSYGAGNGTQARGYNGYTAFSISRGAPGTMTGGGRIVTAEDELAELMFLLDVA